MKNWTIEEMEIRNFKGIRRLHLRPEQNNFYFGDNGSGKSSIVDAYFWCLFGYDARGNHERSFKVEPNLEVLPKARRRDLEVKVKIKFASEDNIEFEIERVMQENWERQEGSKAFQRAAPDYTYKINKQPVKKGVFDRTIEEKIGPLETVQLLSNPLHFAEHLHWKDRRRLLMQVIDTPTISELAADVGEPELSGKVDELESFIENSQKTMRKLDKEIDDIVNKLEVVAIEEKFGDISKLEEKKEELKEELKELQRQSGSSTAELEKKRAEIKKDWIRKINEQVAEKNQELNELRNKISNLKRDKREFETTLNRLEDKKEELVKQYKEVESKKVDNCGFCGQPLPDDMKEKARSKRSEHLKEIQQEGNKVINQLKTAKKELAKVSKQLETEKEKEEELQDKIAELQNKEEGYKELEEYQKISKEIEELEEGQENFEEEITELEEELEEVREKIAEHKVATKNLSKKKELEEELESKQEHYEQLAYMVDKATQAAERKYRLLEERANNLLDKSTVKLFEEKQNGNKKETCKIYGSCGSEFEKNLNNSDRIRIGVEIINILAEEFGLRVPIWVDNAEAITEVVETDSQLFYLAVVNEDKFNPSDARELQIVRTNNNHLYVVNQ